jgi:hypothetical protein
MQRALIAISLLTLSATLGCGRARSEITLTPAPSATPAATATPTARATPTSSPRHPPGTRTGIAEVDAVINAVLARDVKALAALVSYHTFPCVAVQRGPGDTPPCPPGVPDGTPVDAMSFESCEGALIPMAFFEGFAAEMLAPDIGLYAAYLHGPNDPPTADGQRIYTIVFVVPPSRGVLEGVLAFYVSDGSLYRIQRPCQVEPPSQFLERATLAEGSQLVLPPPEPQAR